MIKPTMAEWLLFANARKDGPQERTSACLTTYTAMSAVTSPASTRMNNSTHERATAQGDDSTRPTTYTPLMPYQKGQAAKDRATRNAVWPCAMSTMLRSRAKLRPRA